ncbi:hypothetical protein TMatcc_007449 [Talaromyces marneffei ATCC 18224]
MALQPDRVHEAEENSSHYFGLLGLINQELQELPDIIDFTPELLLQTPHDNNPNDFVNNPGLPPPGEPVNFLTQLVSDAEFIDPRFLNEQPSNRLPSPESDPGDPPRVITVADAIAFVERGTTVESTYWQQRFEIGVPEAILEATHEATRQNKQKKLVRNCLKCRFEKKKCEHPTKYDARCLPANLAAYDMLFIPPDLLMKMTHALYANVIARLNTQRYLRSDDKPMSLHIVLEDSSSSTGLQNEHDVVFYIDWLRRMLQMDTHSHSTVIEPAIDVARFDDFISMKMWPGHEQQPESKFTQAQEDILQTARLFCGYVTLLANLDRIEIYTEYTEQYTAKSVCIVLVYFFIYRLCQLYQELGHNLQALVDETASNHYIVARALELIYGCRDITTPIEWSTANRPFLRPLVKLTFIHALMIYQITNTITTQDDMRLLLNERLRSIRSDVSYIERCFNSPYRGNRRSLEHPTMKAADKLQLPNNLQIYFEGKSSRLSTNMMRTRNGGYSMRSVTDLLSSRDSYHLPPSDQTFMDPDQPIPPFANTGLPLDNGEYLTGLSSTQILEVLGSHALDTRIQSPSAQANAATRPPASIGPDLENELSSSGGHTWGLAMGNTSRWFEGGTSNSFCDPRPTKTL